MYKRQDKERATALQEFDRKLFNERQSYQGMEKFILTDGQEHTLMVNKNFFAHDGNNWLVCSAFDITELQRQREEIESITRRLSLALHISKHLLWIYDIQTENFILDSMQLKGDVYKRQLPNSPFSLFPRNSISSHIHFPISRVINHVSPFSDNYAINKIFYSHDKSFNTEPTFHTRS